MDNSRFKFRVWDNGYLDNSLYMPSITADGIVFAWTGDFGTEKEIQDCVIEQSTGLYDCEGKEVFEGDIVRYQTYLDEGIALIAWHSNLACYKLQVNKGDNLCHMINYPVSDWRYKVIGNRFTNPELLEAQK